MPALSLPLAETDRLTQAFDLFGDELVYALSGLLGDPDDARDVAQETFLKCWRGRERLHEVRDLKAWIFRVGLNAARDLQRNGWRKRSRPLLEDCYQADGDSVDEIAQGQELLQRLAAAVATLRSAEREVFLLRQQQELTYEEIAHRLHTPLGTVKTRMRAALSRLRRAFVERTVPAEL